jgi:hypothetical protein
MEAHAPDTVPPKKPAHPATVRYMGFQCTSEGRSYSLRVDGGGGEPRLVTVIIPNEAFSSRKARFQEGPELCFARLQRELGANADLPDGLELVITTTELDEHREAQQRRSPDRRNRTPRAAS